MTQGKQAAMEPLKTRGLWTRDRLHNGSLFVELAKIASFGGSGSKINYWQLLFMIYPFLALDQCPFHPLTSAVLHQLFYI